jgi:iron complex transport system ATP-binding protein
VIEMRGVAVRYGATTVVEEVSCGVARGVFAGGVGAHGSGKTSLLKLIARMLVPAAGTVLVDGREVAAYSRRELARKVAGVWQRAPLSFGFTVRQLVLLGRTPHLAPMHWETHEDLEIAGAAMEETQIAHLAERPATQLSAGELQRVFIATALAQQSPILLLDEPTSFLDLRQSARLSALLNRLHERGVTILCASHDLPFLRRHASSAVLLANRRLDRAGDTSAVLARGVLQNAFGLQDDEWYD